MATQINLHVTPEFERDLDLLRRLRGVKSKSEAIRLAVSEAVRGTATPPRFESWVGLAATASPNARLRFQDHAAVWDDDGH